MTILNRTPTSAIDVVAVFGPNGTQVFEGAAIMRAEVTENKKLMQHPVESARTITDHVVIEPTSMTFYLIPSPNDYRNIYQEVKSLYDRSTLLTVQTRVDVHTNILIESLPREESPDVFNTVSIEMKMREVLLVSGQIVELSAENVSNPGDQSTTERGQQAGGTATADQTEQSSILYRTFIE